MPNIRPVSDLRNHFAEITKDAQLSGEDQERRRFHRCHEHGELQTEPL